MNAVWNTMIDGIQGKFVKPVDIALPAQQYDMGKPVGKRTAPRREVEAVAAAVTVVAAERKGTKAEVVRACIRTAKANGTAQADVVAEVIALLGMARALAATYVKNNWDKA